MRDTSAGMPEFIEAFEKDDHYFVVVSMTLGDETKRFQFGVSRNSYRVVKSIMQTRVFDMMPGLKYRYYYSGSCGALNSQKDKMTIRIEQGRDSISKQFEVTKELHANLLWFSQLDSFETALYLEIDS